jgi:hypothetical protein
VPLGFPLWSSSLLALSLEFHLQIPIGIDFCCWNCTQLCVEILHYIATMLCGR